MRNAHVRLGRTIARNWWQRQLYRTMKVTPRKYGNAVIVLDMLCNSSCGMCSSWAKNTPEGTLTATQWRGVVDRLHAYNPDIKISFVGGEPLLVDGLMDLLRHCRDQGIIFSLVTNGILLDAENIKEILDTEPIALHVSFDSLKPAIYKRMRGVDATEQVQANIKELAAIASARNSPVHLGLKTTVATFNLAETDEIAQFASDLNLGVHFQPVLADNKVAAKIMQVNPDVLAGQVVQLTDRIEKRGATNIANTAAHIRRWPTYFEGNETKRSHCATSVENLFIQHDGNVKLCERYTESIGNVLTESISEITRSAAAKDLRAKTFGCQRNCTFIYQRGPKDYWRIFRTMRRRQAAARNNDSSSRP